MLSLRETRNECERLGKKSHREGNFIYFILAGTIIARFINFDAIDIIAI